MIRRHPPPSSLTSSSQFSSELAAGYGHHVNGGVPTPGTTPRSRSGRPSPRRAPVITGPPGSELGGATPQTDAIYGSTPRSRSQQGHATSLGSASSSQRSQAGSSQPPKYQRNLRSDGQTAAFAAVAAAVGPAREEGINDLLAQPPPPPGYMREVPVGAPDRRPHGKRTLGHQMFQAVPSELCPEVYSGTAGLPAQHRGLKSHFKRVWDRISSTPALMMRRSSSVPYATERGSEEEEDFVEASTASGPLKRGVKLFPNAPNGQSSFFEVVLNRSQSQSDDTSYFQGRAGVPSWRVPEDRGMRHFEADDATPREIALPKGLRHYGFDPKLNPTHHRIIQDDDQVPGGPGALEAKQEMFEGAAGRPTWKKQPRGMRDHWHANRTAVDDVVFGDGDERLDLQELNGAFQGHAGVRSWKSLNRGVRQVYDDPLRQTEGLLEQSSSDEEDSRNVPLQRPGPPRQALERSGKQEIFIGAAGVPSSQGRRPGPRRVATSENVDHVLGGGLSKDPRWKRPSRDYTGLAGKLSKPKIRALDEAVRHKGAGPAYPESQASQASTPKRTGKRRVASQRATSARDRYQDPDAEAAAARRRRRAKTPPPRLHDGSNQISPRPLAAAPRGPLGHAGAPYWTEEERTTGEPRHEARWCLRSALV